MSNRPPDRVYGFGDFRLDVATRTLVTRSERHAVRLPNAAIEALVVLVARAGELVSKDDLLKAVWHDVNVEENSLMRCISTLRRGLGDRTSDPRFIATVPGRGYRFIADVDSVTEASHEPFVLQAYVTGFSAMTRPGSRTLEAGLRSLQAAVAREPEFALAHCRLAYCYMLLGVFGIRSPLDVYPRALASARRAIAIDARSFDAEAQVAHLKGLCGDHAAAEEGLRHTLTKDPANFIAHHLMGLWLLRKGQFEKAMASMRRAQQVQPLAPTASANIGMTYYYARRYEEAIDQMQTTLDMDPTFDHARSYLGRTYLRLGQTDLAMQQFQQRRGATYCSAGDVPSALALGGRRTEALRHLQALLESTSYVSGYDIASAYAALGDTNAALQWLDRALEMTFIDVDPAFDAIRQNARFHEIVASFPCRMRSLAL